MFLLNVPMWWLLAPSPSTNRPSSPSTELRPLLQGGAGEMPVNFYWSAMRYSIMWQTHPGIFLRSYLKIPTKCTEFNGSSGKVDATHCQMLFVHPSNVPSLTKRKTAKNPSSWNFPPASEKSQIGKPMCLSLGWILKHYQLQQGFIWSVTCPGWRNFKVPMAVRVALPQDKVGAEGSKLSNSAGWNLCLLESWCAQVNRKLKTPQRMGYQTSVKVLAFPTQSQLIQLGLRSLQRGYLWIQGTVWLLTCKWAYYMQMTLFILWKWA